VAQCIIYPSTPFDRHRIKIGFPKVEDTGRIFFQLKYHPTDLNSFTKKHLDFFYKKVLQLQPQQAVPDKAHLVFEIQNQLKRDFY